MRTSSRRLRTRMGDHQRRGPSMGKSLDKLEFENRIWELQEENGMAAANVLDSFESLAQKIPELADLEMLDEMLRWVDDTKNILGRFNGNYAEFAANVKAQDKLDRQYQASEEPLVEGSTRTALSDEPTQRAFERMDDACRRGGIKGLITAIGKRIKVTKDYDKMQGIITVISDLVGDLNDLKREAQRKA